MISPNAKENYQQKTATRLKTIRTRITSLEKQAGKAEADIKVRYDQKMDQIRGQYAQVKDKLEELGKARQAAWVEQKLELDRAIETLSEAIDSMTGQISV
jgi:ParB-like chromosome segregation protein Spo0J